MPLMESNSPKGGVTTEKSEPEEQIYLLELIVESVKVEKEGILDEFKADKMDDEGAVEPTSAVSVGESQTEARQREAKNKSESLGPTKIIVKFFEFPPIEIAEKEYVTPPTDATAERKEEGEPAGGDKADATSDVNAAPTGENQGDKQEDNQQKIKHTTGKSCLFPMMPTLLIDVIKRHPLEIQLSRAAGHGPQAMPAHVIGQTRIHLEQKFIDTVVMATTPVILPIAASIENGFDLKNVFGDVTATVKLVIRLSCFGSNIFTQFNYVKGEQGFQFKTSERVTSGLPDAKKKEEIEKGRATDYSGDCQPEFTDETTVGFLPENPASKKADVFRRAVPWRRLKDEVPMTKICGPKNLFTEAKPPVKCPFQKDNINFKEMFPSLAFKPGLTNVPKPGEAKLPAPLAEFGDGIPPMLKKLMPGQAGTSSGPVEAPPGAKFPCQFGSSWLHELPPETPKGFVCTNTQPGSTSPGKFVCTSSEKAKPTSGCPCADKSGGAPSNAPARFQPGIANAPPFPQSPAPLKCMQCECGLADQTTSRPPVNDSKAASAKAESGSSPSERVACPFLKSDIQGMQNGEPGQFPAFGQTAAGDPRGQQPGNVKGMQACPAFTPSRQPPTMNAEPSPSCGLAALASPDQQNLKNLLSRPIMPPACPADSAQGVTSLCTCPKVSTPEQKPNYGFIRCECSNILTSVKPIDMPFSCGPPCPAASSSTGQEPSRVQPVPISLPPPPPECPLAQLLQQAAAAEQRSAAERPTVEPPSSLSFGHQPSGGYGAGGPPPDQSPRGVTDQERSQPRFHASPARGEESSGDETKKMVKHKGKKKGAKNNSPEGDYHDKALEDTTTDMDDTDKDKSKRNEEKATAILKEEVQTYDADNSEVGPGEKPTKLGGQKSKKKKKGGEEQQDQPADQRGSNLPPFIGEKDAEIAYTYTAGMYPGVNVGHKNCVPVFQLVPKNMGWLWNVRDGSGYLKPGRGWRPGSIQTQVMKVIDYVKKSEKENVKLKGRGLGVAKAHSGKLKSHKETSGQQQAPMTDESKTQGGVNTQGTGDGSPSSPSAMNTGPTLHLHKSHGVYYVSLYPPQKPKQKESPLRKGKKPTDKEGKESDDEKPIQFRIDPKNPDGDDGLNDVYETDDTSTDSADSYELEFVTPNTMAHRIVRPVKKNKEIQVSEQDILPHGKKGDEADSKSHASSASTDKLTKKKGKRKSSKLSGESKGKGKGKAGKGNKKK